MYCSLIGLLRYPLRFSSAQMLAVRVVLVALVALTVVVTGQGTRPTFHSLPAPCVRAPVN
jgi:hypothetical protein